MTIQERRSRALAANAGQAGGTGYTFISPAARVESGFVGGDFEGLEVGYNSRNLSLCPWHLESPSNGTEVESMCRPNPGPGPGQTKQSKQRQVPCVPKRTRGRKDRFVQSGGLCLQVFAEGGRRDFPMPREHCGKHVLLRSHWLAIS